MTAVDPHPHPQRPRDVPRLRAQRELRRDRRVDRVRAPLANAAWNPSPVVFTT